MTSQRPLAFIDVETTGTRPASDRIREIGVVTVDDTRVESWTSLLRVPSRPGRNADEYRDENPVSPRFQDVAADLLARLAGRIVVAHNARFDYGFLRTEFDRVGMAFEPRLLCSVMLSRRLYPEFDCHDLDALAAYHRLTVTTRHRALPDAELVWQFWQALEGRFPRHSLDDAIDALLAGPVLPEGLDPGLVERLPAKPGAYVLHGEGNKTMMIGAAHNLRTQVTNYFRIDQASDKALAYAHRVTNISWRVTRGLFGAQLHAAMMSPARRAKQNRPRFSCALVPQATPCIEIGSIEQRADGDWFGLFGSALKAQNALRRLASKHALCHGLLGIRVSTEDSDATPCRACALGEGGSGCVGRVSRARQLTRIHARLREWERPSWPYAGAIGVREHADLHVIDQWCYLGTARSEADVHTLLECRPDDGQFDYSVYQLVKRTLTTLSTDRLVRLGDRPRPDGATEEGPHDFETSGCIDSEGISPTNLSDDVWFQPAADAQTLGLSASLAFNGLSARRSTRRSAADRYADPADPADQYGSRNIERNAMNSNKHTQKDSQKGSQQSHEHQTNVADDNRKHIATQPRTAQQQAQESKRNNDPSNSKLDASIEQRHDTNKGKGTDKGMGGADNKTRR